MTRPTEFQTIDERITAFLTARNGRPIGNWEISQHFGMPSTETIKAVKRLERAGIVRPDRSRTQTTYYVPTDEQKAKQQATLEASMKTAAELRAFRPYVVPKPMQDLMARIKAEREAIPSHYGSAA